MRLLYVVHIVGGTLALLAGYTALFSAKGAALHRRSGLLFSGAMLAMCLAGGVMAFNNRVWVFVNLPAAVLTAYLVTTSLTTVRPPLRGERPLAIALMLLALVVGLVCLTFGAEAVANGGRRNGVPAFPFVMFGVVGTLGAVLDIRMMRAGGRLQGASRLTRHLWRMTFALFIAAMSFFIGQAKVIPKPIRILPLLALPVLAVLVTLLYWMWRVRAKKRVPVTTTAEQPRIAEAA